MIPFDSALNSAHQHQRKADKCLGAKKYDESIEHHKKAAECLLDAMTISKCSEALLSLQVQYNNQIRRRSIVAKKQRDAQSIRKSMAEKSRHDDEPAKLPDPKTKELQFAIYQAIVEQDSLLQFLKKAPEALHPPQQQDVVPADAHKMPKTTEDVIEELRTNNEQLKKLIDRLIKDLEECKKENTAFRRRLAESKLVATDIPPLAPLEMPEFDFDSLQPNKT